MGAKRFFSAVMAAVGLACLLSGCLFRQSRAPFGEETYSAERAQAVYAEISADMAREEWTDQTGYRISFMPDDTNAICWDVYKTEEYRVVYGEGYFETCLWYDGCLCCCRDAELTYRDMVWEELALEALAAEKWEFARQLMERDDAELTYKYIPLSSEPYLLKAEYPDIELDGQTIRFAELSFYLDENGGYDGFGLRWQEDHSTVSVSYFSYTDSTDLQAERAVWFFGRDIGLTEETVPALSDQREDRERCQAVIASMDFDSLADRGEYQEDLRLPDLFQ